MAIRRPSRKTLALVLSGIVVFYLLFGWLALPPLLQSQAEKFIIEKTGCHLTMERPQFNPFNLRLRLAGLRLVQSDGQPLLAFRELLVNVSAASIVRGALIFDDIQLDGLNATVDLLPHGRLNWSEFIESLKSKKDKSSSSMPRLDLHRLRLTNARLNFADKRSDAIFATSIEPINLELADLSTLSNQKGEFKVLASTETGAHVALQGQVSLEPVTMIGNVSIENVDLGALPDSMVRGMPVVPSAGLAGASADYRLGYANGRLEFNLEHLAGKLTNLRIEKDRKAGPAVSVALIEAKDGRFDLTKNEFALGTLSATGSKLDLQRGGEGALQALNLGSLLLDNVYVGLAAHQAKVAHIALKDGHIRAKRDARGHIDLLDALQAATEVAQPSPAAQPRTNATTGTPWRYRLDKIDLSAFAVSFRDEAVAPAAELALDDISVSMEGISENQQAAIPLRASFKAHDGGSAEADGNTTLSGPTADIHVKLTGLNLKPAQPYLNQVALLTLEKGLLSTAGRINYNAKGVSYRGGFALNDLRLTESDTGIIFLAWKSLASRAIDVTPTKLNISELKLDGIDTQLIINKDKSVSVSRILKHQETAPASASTSTAASTSTSTPSATAKTAQPFLVNIDRLRFSQGQMNYADYSLTLPFGTRIHHLNGAVTGLSSHAGAPAQMELSGQVDDYGLARAAGQIELFNPADFMDLKVIFTNVEMTRLTPYSATFAGRKIASGKLSLDLEYKIQQGHLLGDNQIIMDQLTLGDKVDSPEATNLPLDLAIAILRDSDGRIDLGLPVSGDLNDPQFSYGSIIWKAFTNVLHKIATAPFRALGALFGGGEKFENVTFEAGNAHLTPPEREKLVKLAGALVKRPGLSLAIHGVYSDQDRDALQDRQLRRAIAEKMGIRLEGKEDPGPMSTRQSKVQSALEDLYAERFSSGELAAIKDGFRRANPGQMEQSTAGKMISRLSGVLHEKRALSEQEVSQLKGADFYAVLYDRLRNKVAVDDASLLALARARGESTAKVLQTAGAPGDRLMVLAAEKVEAAKGGVPVKLVLDAAAKPAVAPAAK
jgi:hypothetical protein